MSTKNWPLNLLIVCLFIQGWLIFFHFFFAYHQTQSVEILGQAFDFTRESTLPTFFSSLLAFLASMASFAVYFIIKRGGVSRIRKWAWLLVGSIFLFIAIDDSMGFHERLGAITSIGLLKSLHYSSFPWHLTVAPVIAGGLLFASFVIWRELRGVEGLRPMLLLALGCFAVGFGIDYLEGVQVMGLAPPPSSDFSKVLPIFMLVEEVLEMAGTAIFLYVFTAYLSHLVTGLQFTLGEELLAQCRTQPNDSPEPEFTESTPVLQGIPKIAK